MSPLHRLNYVRGCIMNNNRAMTTIRKKNQLWSAVNGTRVQAQLIKL